MPIPTTQAGPLGVSTRSARMPQSLRPPTITSFGHFSTAGRPATARMPSATAIPASRGIQVQRGDSIPSGWTSTDMAMLVPGGAVQVRPSRPRPADW